MPRSRKILILAALCAIAAALAAWQWPALEAARRRALSQLYLNHGKKLAASGDQPAAFEDYSRAIHYDPTLADAYTARVDSCFTIEKFAAAVSDLTTLLRLKPGNTHAYMLRALAFEKLGNYEKAIDDYSTILRLHPGLYDARSSRAADFSRLKRYKEAIADYGEMARSGHADAGVYADRAHAYLALNDAGKAIDDFGEAIKLKPEPDYYQQRAKLYVQKREFTKASDDLTELIKSEPVFKNLDERGMVFEAAGLPGKAIADYTAAMEKAGENAYEQWFALNQRAQLYNQTGDYIHARIDYLTATSLEYEESYNHCAWFLITCLDPAFRDAKRAVPFGIKACEATGWTNPEYIETLASAYAEAGEFDKAVNFQAWATGMFTDFSDTRAARARLELYKAYQVYRPAPPKAKAAK